MFLCNVNRQREDKRCGVHNHDFRFVVVSPFFQAAICSLDVMHQGCMQMTQDGRWGRRPVPVDSLVRIHKPEGLFI